MGIVEQNMSIRLDDYRGTKYVLRYTVLSSFACNRCNSEEVYQPAQTLDMPMKVKCLRCGEMAPRGEFKK